MMARLQLWTTALMAVVASSVSLPAAEDVGLPVLGPVLIVKKESHPVLRRQKREWIWNNLYVEEEKPAPVPYLIGRLKSTRTLDVRSFQIDGDGANSIFTVDQKGNLFVTRALDREHKSVYNLTARMYDGNRKLIEDSGDFQVQVTDINDNMPVFPGAYNGSVMERSVIGTKVVQVKANDADDPHTANGDLRYSLIQEVSAFQIDSLSGVISCRTGALDRETRSRYVLQVRAQDMRGIPSGSTATTSVTISVNDTNDNMVSFARKTYELQVPEDHQIGEKIGILLLEDRDLIQNKEPIFSIPGDLSRTFSIRTSPSKDGDLMLRKALDYETTSSYSFTVQVDEDLTHLRFPADNLQSAVTSAQVQVRVLDVDEPPVFSQQTYSFRVVEESLVRNIGSVAARDPDRANRSIRYSILDGDGSISIHPHTGQLSTLRPLDRELQDTHLVQVKAQEEPSGLESLVKVNITVQDINDNKPELKVDEMFLCENDVSETVIGTLSASDKDQQPASFRFSLASESSNFSIRDFGNSTADIVVKTGPFSLDDPKDYSVDVRITDGGQPLQTSVTKLAIKSCRCDARRIPTQCKAGARRMGVSVHALIAILLCILTILVIVILFAVRKRYQNASLSSLKNSGEIHEQLVTYDEEGGGEMDTNGYDVSILSSVCHDGSLLRPHPSLYALVQKAPPHQAPPHQAPPHQAPPPQACQGDMAVMIERKKDEADQDRDGFPFDTLHIYGCEGPGSLAGSLSSMETASSGSDPGYDFLSDWGPRFRTLAELYGAEGPQDHQY